MARGDMMSEDYIREMMSLYRQNRESAQDSPQPAEPVAEVEQGEEELVPIIYPPPAPSYTLTPDDDSIIAVEPEVGLEDAPEEAEIDTSTGFLRIEATTGNGAVPVNDAFAIVTKKWKSRSELIALLLTDENGRSGTVSLPAPPAALSEQPGNSKPYGQYNVDILAEGYYIVKNENVPIFAGVTSLLPVNLIPLPNYKSGDDIITYTEREVLDE